MKLPLNCTTCWYPSIIIALKEWHFTWRKIVSAKFGIFANDCEATPITKSLDSLQKAWSQYHDAMKKWLAETIYVYQSQPARCEIKFTWRLPLEQKIETMHTFGDSIHIPMYWLIFSCIKSRTCKNSKMIRLSRMPKSEIINPKLTYFLQVLFAFFIASFFFRKKSLLQVRSDWKLFVIFLVFEYGAVLF